MCEKILAIAARIIISITCWIGIAILFAGCGMVRGVAVQTAKPLFVDQMHAMYRETDYELASSAFPTYIKMLEGLCISYPKDTQFKLWLIEAMTGYGVGFVEERSVADASRLYLRAREYAIELAEQKIKFDREYMRDLDRLKLWIDNRNKDDVAYLFWLGQSWGAWIAINLDKPDALADVTKVKWIMSRVIELDESYYHAGAHIFLGSVLGKMPVIFGGNPDESLKHFQTAFALTDSSFLLAQYYFIKTYCVTMQDKTSFEQQANHIISFDSSSNPELSLMNTVAQKRTMILNSQKEDLFFDEEI